MQMLREKTPCSKMFGKDSVAFHLPFTTRLWSPSPSHTLVATAPQVSAEKRIEVVCEGLLQDAVGGDDD